MVTSTTTVSVHSGMVLESKSVTKMARVSGEIFGRRKLGWVHKERDNHGVIGLLGALDQVTVPLVQRPHGGHHRHRPLGVASKLAYLVNGLGDPHLIVRP